MSDVNWKPADANWLTPYLMVRDGDAALEFYQRAFGFEEGLVLRSEANTVVHGEVRYMGTLIAMFAPEGTFGSQQRAPVSSDEQSPIGLYVYCENVDMMLARAVQAGAVSVAQAETMFWGDRVGSVKDPDGYVWSFATKVAEFDPNNVPRF